MTTPGAFATELRVDPKAVRTFLRPALRSYLNHGSTAAPQGRAAHPGHTTRTSSAKA